MLCCCWWWLWWWRREIGSTLVGKEIEFYHDDDYDDRFYIALFFIVEQTHCAFVRCYFK